MLINLLAGRTPNGNPHYHHADTVGADPRVSVDPRLAQSGSAPCVGVCYRRAARACRTLAGRPDDNVWPIVVVLVRPDLRLGEACEQCGPELGTSESSPHFGRAFPAHPGSRHCRVLEGLGGAPSGLALW